ncbi:MAG: pyrroloquinoline quinone-dependent dehydrogenase, partial [Vicinamibacterales bacterium]
MGALRWILVGVAIVVCTALGSAQQGARSGEWTRYGGDSGMTKYAPLDQINRTNISQLRLAWRRPSVDASVMSKAPDLSYSNNFRATPLMIGGVLYSPNGIGLVEAFHPGTGKTLWVQQPFPDEPAQGLRGDSARGVAFWSDGGSRRLFVIRGEYLIALDLATGAPLNSFGEKGRVNLRPGLGPR